MLSKFKELQIALRNLCIFGETSSALREELAEDNPDLLAAAAPIYRKCIALLQAEIAEYLYAYPSDVSIAADMSLEVQAI